MTDNISIAVHDFASHMLMSFSVDGDAASEIGELVI